MTRALQFATLLAGMALCSPAWAYTRISRTSGNNGTTGTAFSITIPSTGSGDFLVVVTGCSSSGTPTFTITDNKSGGSSTYSADINAVLGITANYIDVHSSFNIAAAITSVTITPSVSANRATFVEEWSGVKTSAAPLDQTATSHASTGTSWSSTATATLSNANDLAIGLAFNPTSSGLVNTPSGGFGDGATASNSGDGDSFAIENQSLSSTMGIAATGTWGASVSFSTTAGVAAYLPAPAAAGSPALDKRRRYDRFDLGS